MNRKIFTQYRFRSLNFFMDSATIWNICSLKIAKDVSKLYTTEKIMENFV